MRGQGDQQLVFARHPATHAQQLTRLSLSFGGQSAGVDDIRWATSSRGTLIVVDTKAGAVYSVTGPFAAGTAFASLDTIGSEEVQTQVETIELFSGEMSPFVTGLGNAKGLLWLPEGGQGEEGEGA